MHPAQISTTPGLGFMVDGGKPNRYYRDSLRHLARVDPLQAAKHISDRPWESRPGTMPGRSCVRGSVYHFRRRTAGVGGWAMVTVKERLNHRFVAQIAREQEEPRMVCRIHAIRVADRIRRERGEHALRLKVHAGRDFGEGPAARNRPLIVDGVRRHGMMTV